MDWLNDLPSATGIDKIVGEMAKRLMSGPIIFRSPYWGGDVVVETMNEYRAWIRTTERIENEQHSERDRLKILKKEN